MKPGGIMESENRIRIPDEFIIFISVLIALFPLAMYTKKGQIGTYIAFGGNQCSRRENKFNSAWREDGLPRVVLSEDIYHCCYGCNRCGAFTTSMVTRFVITWERRRILWSKRRCHLCSFRALLSCHFNPFSLNWFFLLIGEIIHFTAPSIIRSFFFFLVFSPRLFIARKLETFPPNELEMCVFLSNFTKLPLNSFMYFVKKLIFSPASSPKCTYAQILNACFACWNSQKL